MDPFIVGFLAAFVIVARIVDAFSPASSDARLPSSEGSPARGVVWPLVGPHCHLT